MSYCRFSSDDWKSDVYVYESSRGFEVHVAGYRIVSDVPAMLPMGDDGWIESHRAQMDAVAKAVREPIGGEFDCMDFVYPTAQDTANALKEIANAGYHVPEWVIPQLEDDE